MLLGAFLMQNILVLSSQNSDLSTGYLNQNFIQRSANESLNLTDLNILRMFSRLASSKFDAVAIQHGFLEK